MLIRGDPIPGSELYRNFCFRCGDPIRVRRKERLYRNCLCADCAFPAINRRSSVLVPDGRFGLDDDTAAEPDILASAEWDNVVKAVEGGA